ncbi:MAG: DUF502 domain-containing protein [Rhodospirillaceae bacterium]|nr:hypothetical protein [Rhodospirillaceae bacterium]RPF95205.1 MAG: DUF502 domain-containing protein [Rhodospirillaceae bacterium TMED63]RZO35603.1 MAG: DUF502 domain-containing protein [Rhodospirillaceae bacterium]
MAVSKNKKALRDEARTRLSKQRKGRFRKYIRGYFLAGILVTAPIGITFYISWLLIRWVDSKITPLIPTAYNPETYLPFAVPGLGLIIVFIALTFIGWSTAGLLGRLWTSVSEKALARMPVVRSVYAAVKQIIETILKQQSNAFREVVLFEYPRRGSWAIGFITGQTQGEVQNLTADDVVNVFLPTTPNPTSGYLLFIPRRELVILDMTVEEGIKMVVSGGIVTPPDRRPAAEREQKRVAPADGDTRTVPFNDDTKDAAQ